MEKEKILNLIILGDKGVGKSSIFNIIKERALNEDINDKNEDINELNDIDCFNIKRKYERRNVTISLNIKDIKNQENFKDKLPVQYIRDSHIVLLVYSDIETLNSIKENWYKYYKENTNIDNSRFILVGNKSDTFGDKRDEIVNQGNKFAEEIDAYFITCSVKSKDNMDNLERFIITEAKRFIDEGEKKPENNNNLKLENVEEDDNNSNKGKCCGVSC